MKRTACLVAWALLLSLPIPTSSALAADVVKADNADNLNLTTSWSGGVAPTSSDVGVWNSTVTSANSTSLGGNLSWGGLRIDNPGGDVTIGGVNSLTLGSSGLNTGSTANLTYNSTGTIVLTSGGALAGSTTLTIDNNTTKNWSNSGTGMGSVTFTGSLVLRGGTGAGGSFSGNWLAFGNSTVTQTGSFNLDTGASLANRGELIVTDGWGDGGAKPKLTLNSLTGYGDFRSDWGVNSFRTVNVNQSTDTTFNGRFVSSSGSRGIDLEKSGSGTLTLSGVNSQRKTTVSGGTLKIGNAQALGDNTAISATSVGKNTVQTGAAIDFNGIADAAYGYTIAGTGVGGTGALVNTGGAIGNTSKQATNITLSANASVGGTAGWGLLASGYGATNLDLAGFTLTKTGGSSFGLATTTVTAGTIDIQSGTVNFGWGGGGSGVTAGSTAVSLANTSGVGLTVSRASSIGSLAGGGGTGGNVTLSAALTVGALNADTTYSGVLSGGSALTKTGTGKLTLAGVNTNTGNVTVSQGTLVFGINGAGGNPNTTGPLGPANTAVTKVSVASGAVLDINGKIDTGYGITIAGNGSGAGALINTGSSTSLGSIQTPNIALSANATLGGTGDFAMIASGYGANALTLNNNTLTKSGGNTFYLTNTTVSSGTIQISGGTLKLHGSADSNASAAAVVLDNTSGVSLDLNGRAFQAGSLAGGGATGGNVALDGGTLTVGALATDTSFGGAIAGAGALVKTGTGKLALGGANAYTGTTSVNDGTLLVNGTHTGGGAYTVASGAILGGNGSTASDVTVTGIIAPGTSIGTLGVGNTTIDGNYLLETDNAGLSDLLNVTGLLTLGGSSVLDLDAGSTLNPALIYTIASYTTLSGTFGTIDSAITDHYVDYLTGNQIRLVPVPEPASFAMLALGAVALLWFRKC